MADIQFTKDLELLKQAIAFELRTALVNAAPGDTGALKRSLKVLVTNNGFLISMVDYGKFVEFGTNPHIIKPKGKALKFKGKEGKTVFTKIVRHPGTRPNPFIRTTIFTKLPQIVKQEIRRQL